MTKKKSKKVLIVRAECVDQLNEDQAKTLLCDLMEKLDDLDCQDFFGTEGWRQYFGYGD